MLKRVATVVGSILVLAVIGIGLLAVLLPLSVAPQDIRLAPDPETLARGDYLFNSVLGCPVCHSERDWSRFGAPPMPPLGGGRRCETSSALPMGLAESQGFPGTVCFRNITPDVETGIGAWSNGEIVRAIREGVDRDNNALFPTMPYFIFANLADSDAEAVVAYLRTLPPVDNPLPDTDINFPVNLLIRLAPRPVREVVELPDPETTEYGAYLATVARCRFCHSPRNPRTRLAYPDREFSGGVEFRGREGVFLSTNLTPDPDGLGSMSRQDFIALFRRGEDPTRSEIDIMPWTYYAGMSDADLGAIYDYLQTLPAREFGG